MITNEESIEGKHNREMSNIVQNEKISYYNKYFDDTTNHNDGDELDITNEKSTTSINFCKSLSSHDYEIKSINSVDNPTPLTTTLTTSEVLVSASSFSASNNQDNISKIENSCRDTDNNEELNKLEISKDNSTIRDLFYRCFNSSRKSLKQQDKEDKNDNSLTPNSNIDNMASESYFTNTIKDEDYFSQSPTIKFKQVNNISNNITNLKKPKITLENLKKIIKPNMNIIEILQKIKEHNKQNKNKITCSNYSQDSYSIESENESDTSKNFKVHRGYKNILHEDIPLFKKNCEEFKIVLKKKFIPTNVPSTNSDYCKFVQMERKYKISNYSKILLYNIII